MNINSYESAIENYDYLDEYRKNKVDYLLEKKLNKLTNKNLWRTFNNIFYRFEKSNNKDLAMFSKRDVERMFKLIPSSSMNTFKMYLSQLNNYELWAIERGINPTGDNPCADLNIHDLVYINQKELKLKYIDWDYIFELKNRILNLRQGTEDIDRVTEQNFLLLCLIRLGLKGNKWSEVLYLKEEDIDFENRVITVTNRNEKTENGEEPLQIVKKIEIEDDRIIDLIKESQLVEGYVFTKKIKNGLDCEKRYMNTGYLVKAEVGQKTVLTPSIFRSRLAVIFESVGEPYIPAKDIFRCAELDMLYDLKEESRTNKLSIDDFINTHLFFEPYATQSGYVSLKELYTNITGDDDILKKTMRYDEEGNRIEVITDFRKYYERRRLKRLEEKKNNQ